MSTAAAVIVIVGAIGAAFWLGEEAMPAITNSGLYGVALAAIGMLATTGVVVAVDIIPWAMPPMTTVAGPVSACPAIRFTGP